MSRCRVGDHKRARFCYSSGMSSEPRLVWPCPRMAHFTILAIGAFSLAACDTKQGGEVEDVNAVESQQKTPVGNLLESIPAPEPLGRPELLDAARRAADAFARRIDDAAAQSALAGRQFALSIPFGCFGPIEANGDASPGWKYEADGKVLTIRAAPDITSESPAVGAVAGGEFEVVEGFWIPWPWLMAESCPAPLAGGVAEAPATPPHVGVAQFFTAEDSRSQRRSGRPYETVTNVEPQNLPGSSGFRLVLRGRLKALPGGDVIICSSGSPRTHPVCLISAEFDEVSFQNPKTGATIANWHAG